MKKTALFIGLLSVLTSLTQAGEIQYPSAKYTDKELWELFVNPPDSTRTKVWWFHGETETTREGIEADLKAFSDKGVGGVVFYDQVHGRGERAAPSMSPEWWDMLKYSAATAKELGLSFEVAVGNGYVTGGPWITPELAMKKTAYVESTVSAARDTTMILNLNHTSDHFRDVALLMFEQTVPRRRCSTY